jgi:hypothetical protein
MANYKPNFMDPRVQRRCQTAIDFCNSWLSTSKSRPISKHILQKNFGASNRLLGAYLRNQLLVVADNRFNMNSGLCKKYTVNLQNLKTLSRDIGIDSSATSDFERYQDELTSGEFKYNHTSNRQYHPIQNLPKRVKRPALAKFGYKYHYDIVCCAPTLLLQYARSLGFTTATPNMDLYLVDRTRVRDDISKDCNIPVEYVKRAITGLFQGAYLSHNEQTRIIMDLEGNHIYIDALKSNKFICGLREEIKLMWQSITPTMTREYSDKQKSNGDFRVKPITGRQKARLYRELEEQVMLVIKKYLKRTSNLHLLEHDGWSCREVIDPIELRTLVRTTTGYVIDIDWEIFNDEE